MMALARNEVWSSQSPAGKNHTIAQGAIPLARAGTLGLCRVNVQAERFAIPQQVGDAEVVVTFAIITAVAGYSYTYRAGRARHAEPDSNTIREIAAPRPSETLRFLCRTNVQ